MSMSTYIVTWKIAREFVDSMQAPEPKDEKSTGRQLKSTLEKDRYKKHSAVPQSRGFL